MGDKTGIEWTDATWNPVTGCTKVSQGRSGIRDTDLAYLAGMIDGDGYITINRSQRGKYLYHAPQIGIAGTRREPHDLAASFWGGKVRAYVPHNSTHRPQFQWSRQGSSAAEVIAAIQPYLRIKSDHAALALELWEHIELGKSDDPFPWFFPDYDPLAARDAMRDDMIDINQSRNRLRRRPGYPQEQPCHSSN